MTSQPAPGEATLTQPAVESSGPMDVDSDDESEEESEEESEPDSTRSERPLPPDLARANLLLLRRQMQLVWQILRRRLEAKARALPDGEGLAGAAERFCEEVGPLLHDRSCVLLG